MSNNPVQLDCLSTGEISYNSAYIMNIKVAWKYTMFTAGITLTAIVILSSPWSKAEPECFASEGQMVVRWKDMFWYPCKYSWKGICLWPIRRKHITYKVTVNEGIPVRDENGAPIPVAGGKIRKWLFTIRQPGMGGKINLVKRTDISTTNRLQTMNM